MNDKKEIIGFNNPHKTNTITINGKEYEPINQPDKNNSSRGRMSRIIASMAPYMLAMESNNNNGYKRQRPMVNVIEEFRLIQEKKSALCRSDRDWVIANFNRLYKEVE